jgi:ribosomal protein S27E
VSKVVFLAHRNENMDTEYTEYLACKNCRNKTYVVVYGKASEFPSMRCACCGSEAGYFGWVDEENI